MSGREVTWATPLGVLCAREPSPAELARHAPALAAAYNDPRNMHLLGHTAALTADDVIAHYAGVDAEHGHGFVLLRDGALAGDADLRGVTFAPGVAGAPDELFGEFAFLIAAPADQGKGLGTAFATMIHAFAFRDVGLGRLYASVLPANVGSRRVFEKLGYAVDASPRARQLADEGDVVLSIDRATFLARHADVLPAIVLGDAPVR